MSEWRVHRCAHGPVESVLSQQFRESVSSVRCGGITHHYHTQGAGEGGREEEGRREGGGREEGGRETRHHGVGTYSANVFVMAEDS